MSLSILRQRGTAADDTAAPSGGAGVAGVTGPAGVQVAARWLRAGDGYAATLAVTGYPAEVGPAWLEPLLCWPGRLDITVHVDPVPTAAAARLRRQRARLESSRPNARCGVYPERVTSSRSGSAIRASSRLAE
jgi:hypothetical protein